MKKFILPSLVVILVLLFVFGAVSRLKQGTFKNKQAAVSDSKMVQTQQISSDPAKQSNENQTQNLVVIKDFVFSPQNITIKSGQTVIWTNQDSMAHTVKFADFSSQPLSTGQSFSHTFSAPGVYSYICGIHPSMRGIVTVQ